MYRTNDIFLEANKQLHVSTKRTVEGIDPERFNYEEIGFFRQLSSNEMNLLRTHITCWRYPKRKTIHEEGQHIKGVYLILNGIIKITLNGSKGKEQIIRFSKKGDILGLKSLQGNELFCTTAETMTETDLCFIPRQALGHLLKNNHNLSYYLLREVCNELKEANNFLFDISRKKLSERVAAALVVLYQRFNVDENNKLNIELPRVELAKFVGTPPESLIKSLNILERNNLISLEGKQIKINRIQDMIRYAKMKTASFSTPNHAII